MDNILEILNAFWNQLQNGLLPELGWWNYVLLAVLVALEGPIVTLLGAAAAAAGFLRLPLVFLAASAGNLTADLVWYSLGYTGNIEWLQIIGRKVGIEQQKQVQLQKSIQKHGPRMLLAAKLSVGLMIPTLVAAGLARLPIKRWLPYLMAGEIVWTGALTLIGFFATQAIKQVEKGIEYLVLGLSTLFILFFLFWIRRQRTQKSFEIDTKDI